jgi:hypothetical protein
MIRNQTLYNGRSSTFSLKVIINILRVLVLRVLIQTSTPSDAGNCQITFLKPTISHLLKHEIKGQASTQLFLITIIPKVISYSPLVPFNRPKDESSGMPLFFSYNGRTIPSQTFPTAYIRKKTSCHKKKAYI